MHVSYILTYQNKKKKKKERGGESCVNKELGLRVC